MKTIEEVLKIVPGTKAEDWHQHGNGKGWVYSSASVADSAYVGPDAQVSGNARVYGNAWVSGYAQVSGNAWVKSPLYIQGSRHPVTLCSHTKIAIGCQVHKISYWKKKYKAIGVAEGYLPSEIREYGEYITLLAKAARRLTKCVQGTKTQRNQQRSKH